MTLKKKLSVCFAVLVLISLLLFPRSDGLNDIIAKLKGIRSVVVCANSNGKWVVDYFHC